MAHVDALAARAARNEARGDNTILWVDGREYKLVAEMFMDAVEAWGNHDRKAFVTAVLVDPAEADDFLAARHSWPDLNVVWNLILGITDVNAGLAEKVGEASASSPSSPKGSRRSKPTSKGTTSST